MAAASFDNLPRGDSINSYTHVDSEKLKNLVVRATSSTNGEGDPAAMVEIQEILSSTPEILPDAVHYIKCRIKVLHQKWLVLFLQTRPDPLEDDSCVCFMQAKDAQVSVISMGLLDQCMMVQDL